METLLGAGGMGKVYKAFDKVLSRTVALKTLQPELVTDPRVIQRFKQELLLASRDRPGCSRCLCSQGLLEHGCKCDAIPENGYPANEIWAQPDFERLRVQVVNLS
jgi:serine/threonine protein kinase